MSGLFGEGPTAMARDPMLLRVGDLWHCYYAAHPAGRHGIWLRTSEDLERFGPSTLIMTGGQAGDRWWHFECPFVVPYQGAFYLFHTQNYAVGQRKLLWFGPRIQPILEWMRMAVSWGILRLLLPK